MATKPFRIAAREKSHLWFDRLTTNGKSIDKENSVHPEPVEGSLLLPSVAPTEKPQTNQHTS
jgi:hypothetical protein